MQESSILPAWVANHSAGFGSSYPLTELAIITCIIKNSPFCLQYRLEISGLRTRKMHAQFLREGTFDACVSFCYSRSSMAFFSFFSQQKARQKAVPTNTAKSVSADKQTADWFLAMHGMVLVYRR